MAELDTTIIDSVVSYLDPIFEFFTNLFNSGYGFVIIGVIVFLLIFSLIMVIVFMIKRSVDG